MILNIVPLETITVTLSDSGVLSYVGKDEELPSP